MEDLEYKKRENGPEWLLGNIRDCVEFLAVCWTFLMLTVFPLYVIDKYYDIGAYKFSFFQGTSTLFLVPGAVLGVLCQAGELILSGKDRRHIAQGASREAGGAAWQKGFSCLDAGVCLYFGASLLSFLLSDFKQEAWKGADGWNMGLKTQLLMLAAYYVLSRFFPWKGADGRIVPGRYLKLVSGGAFLGAGLTFLLGILHRFGVDPLGMYDGIDSSYQLLFLSTIGQATWYSSYVCTVLPLGVCLFWCMGQAGGKGMALKPKAERRLRLAAGIYCVLGFMTVVTQNSDSAFAAMALMFLGLFVVSCASPQRMEAFLETWILCAASFKAVGFLQWGFADRAMELGRLSMAFSRGAASWGMLLIGTICYILLLRWEARTENFEQRWPKVGCRLSKAALGISAGGIALAVLIILGNTTGTLERLFGFASSNQYLLFDDKWGSNRGFTWKTAAEIYGKMPFIKKLFGAGPDCFTAYSYSIPEYAQRLNDYWKPNVLTNAHNEFLNLLICIGLIGLVCFLILLGSALKRLGREGVRRPLVLAGFLAVCAYAAHNFFCYQQVCCTPFLFLILGLSEGLARKRDGF